MRRYCAIMGVSWASADTAGKLTMNGDKIEQLFSGDVNGCNLL
jgi:hypothetical protein